MLLAAQTNKWLLHIDLMRGFLRIKDEMQKTHSFKIYLSTSNHVQ